MADQRSRRSPGQPLFERFIVAQMRAHQAYPESAMIGCQELEKLVNKHVVTEFSVHRDEFVVETHGTGCGTVRPLVPHRPDVDGRGADVYLVIEIPPFRASGVNGQNRRSIAPLHNQTNPATSRIPAKGGHRARRKPYGLVATCWR